MAPALLSDASLEGNDMEGAKPIEHARLEDTGYHYALSPISGKYKRVILSAMMEYQPVQFNEMQRFLLRVSDKTLSQQLKQPEADGLIARHMYPQVPPGVEYTLTERGESLMVVLEKLCDLGNAHRNESV